MKIVQINTIVNSGSTGKIAENIGRVIMVKDHESHICFGRGENNSASKLFRIGNSFDTISHGLMTRLFDLHGFGSKAATKKLIRYLDLTKPDLIHLHNLHGYYINIEILFEYVKIYKLPVVWTLHDCWPFTGHCSYFDSVNCRKWEDQCYYCPLIKTYPKSWFIDNSRNNYIRKRNIFSGVNNMVIVTPSIWLGDLVKKSFLKEYRLRVINNGVDLNKFRQVDTVDNKKKFNLARQKTILGVANIWDKRKGLDDFLKLRLYINPGYQIILVGLSKQQITGLPEGITGMERTENLNELTGLYSLADVFINPTYSDNFPSTNIEALACGTPVITYDTGGSGEAVDEFTGRKVKKGDIDGLVRSIEELTSTKNSDILRAGCRQRAEKLYNQEDRFVNYLDLYEELENT